jgi:hypothetical protein
MMKKVGIVLTGALLALLPALSVRAQAPVTVAFRLALTGSVGPEDGFSVLYYAGSSTTAAEAVFCGEALQPAQAAGAHCLGHGTVYSRRVSVPAGTRIHFDVVRARPTYQLIRAGTMTPRGNAAIDATYPHAAGAVPITFQLTFASHPAAALSSADGGLYFAVTYPYVPRRGWTRKNGGLDPNSLYADLPLCATVAHPANHAYAAQCRTGGSYAATIYVPPGTSGRYVFDAFWWGKPVCAASSPGTILAAGAAIRVSMRVEAGSGRCLTPGIFGGAGLEFG